MRDFFTGKSRFWNKPIDASDEPFFAVVGLHSSGSSALAGALCRLGVAMGTRFVGFYGEAPYFGGEDEELAAFLETHLPLPSTTPRRNADDVRRWWDDYLRRRLSDAKERGTVAGAKYPQLALLREPALETLGDRLRLIVCERPFDDSVRSLQKRFPNELPEAIEAHQRYLADSIRAFVAQIPSERVVRVDFKEAVVKTRETIDRLADFIRPEATEAERRAAVLHIRPELKHF